MFSGAAALLMSVAQTTFAVTLCGARESFPASTLRTDGNDYILLVTSHLMRNQFESR
jgi:hypothetical protein